VLLRQLQINELNRTMRLAGVVIQVLPWVWIVSMQAKFIHCHAVLRAGDGLDQSGRRNMNWKCERGFSFVEFLMVATMLSFVSTGVKTFVIDRVRGGPQRKIARQDLAVQGRASVERMVRELELAGQTSPHGTTEQVASSPESNPIAPAFLVAAADQVVFEADLDSDGVVERVEYRLHDSAVERSVVSKNADGSLPPAAYEVLTEYVDNGSLPVFRYSRYSAAPASEGSAPGDIQAVWVTLLLRPPVLSPKRPEFRTLRFDGLARRHAKESENAIAALQQP